MRFGICKLCLKHKPLCKESHIIPRFLYRFINGENNKIVFIDKDKHQFKFNGEYDKYILCENCESVIIGKLDNYFEKFTQKPHSRFEKLEGKDVMVIDDSSYDYNKYKLFLLSLLWRASISSRPFFKQVKLSEEVEEDLRCKILNSNPGEPNEYPCFINLPPIITDNEGRTGFHTFYMPTMSPIYLKKDELEICEFVIEGIHFYFFVSIPSSMNVESAIDKTKLTLGFNSPEEQWELVEQIINIMKKHKRGRV